MRALALDIAVVIVALFLSTLTAAAAAPRLVPAANPGPVVPILSIEVIGETVGTSYVFSPNVIIIPQVPITLNITFFNNQTPSTPPVYHTFTVNDQSGKRAIDSGPVNPQSNVSIRFTINSMTNVTYNGTSFKPGPYPNGPDNGTIEWYCIPHVSLGMVGTIVLGGFQPPSPSKGVFIRAYWIGMIAIVAMLVWIGVSYFLIKGSSPRFKDNREHLRKGLP